MQSLQTERYVASFVYNHISFKPFILIWNVLDMLQTVWSGLQFLHTCDCCFSLKYCCSYPGEITVESLIPNAFIFSFFWYLSKMVSLMNNATSKWNFVVHFSLGCPWYPLYQHSIYVSKPSINNIQALVQIMAWCWIGDKSISEPILTQLTDVYMRH